MKFAIIGRTEILYSTAEYLIKLGYKLALVVTAKEAPEYSTTSADFKSLASQYKVPFLYSKNISSNQEIEFIQACDEIDIGISINYTRVITQEVIDCFRLGILNAHGGDLPRYRGNACQAWAIINRESRIGHCIHKMIGSELDSGDIIERRFLDIDENTRVGECYQWMTDNTPTMFGEAVQKLESNSEYYLEQQSKDPTKALRCYPRSPDDGRIDWHKSALDILRLINASSEPYAGAFCTYKNKVMRIWRARLYSDQEQYLAIPGQVSTYDRLKGTAIIICGDGKLAVEEVEVEEQRGVATDFIKGIRERLK